MSFFADFFETVDDNGEVQVLCPFDHYTSNGLPYKESHPSAHVNTTEHVFHCKVCHEGFSQQQFIQRLAGCSKMNAMRIERCFANEESEAAWDDEVILTEETKQRVLSLGISEQVMKELKIKTPDNTGNIIGFPVLMFGHLLDVRKYNPGHKPKVLSRADCPAGLIVPFELWQETPARRVTLICAGEKDMAIARTKGFNAITITGGEGAETLLPKYFVGRKVAIVYDNDGAGVEGAIQLAEQLYEYTKEIKVVTGFHEVCKEQGEDIWDFFQKYGKTKQDLIDYISNTSDFVPDPTRVNSKAKKQMTLLEAAKPDNLKKLVQSNVQVVAVHDTTFAMTSAAVCKKWSLSGQDDSMCVGETREWEYDPERVEEVLGLMDNNFKEDEIKSNLKHLAQVPFKERNINVKTVETETVFKCSVTDLFETTSTEYQPMEFTAYSIGHKLESGKKYLVTYKLVPHPYKGQQLVMLITGAKTANDSVSNFRVTDSVKRNLEVIRSLEGSVSEKIDVMTQKVKGLLGYDGNDTLIQAIDLSYNTALQFNFGRFKNVRAYLDTIVVGESRVGKSSTADCLRQAYELGVFTSLAGNSATVPGLIGGSNKTASGFQTRAGIIPQNHRGMVIFEEFGKSNNNVVAELTDIRSSNEVRITRVSGTITLPAMVRMLSLTNVKNTGSTIKPIAAYPNGISIITELVPTAEDIARYDMVVILPDRGASQIDPLWEAQEPFDKQVYQDRIRWIWSRSSDQIIIDPDVSHYIIDKANELNKEYECHIKIFGTEAWKKITRLAIAVAGYVVSTDDYEKIKVTQDHVDFAVDFYKMLYDNPTFKLKEYVDEEREYSTMTEDSIAILQDTYTKSPGLIMELERCSATTRPILCSSTGMSQDELSKVLTLLTRCKHVRMSGNDIYPTERFRKSIREINKNTRVERLGV